jgi:hypothetical protein
MSNAQTHIFFACLVLLAFLAGCREETPRTAAHSRQEEAKTLVVEKVSAPAQVNVGTEAADRQPPQPPLREDFQGEPKLPFFPRVGDFQPPRDSQHHPRWRALINQLVKVTGVAENAADGSRGWVFRSIDSSGSLGYFSPVAVEPDRIYQVTFKLIANLPPGASAGISILEFDEFLWIGEQYTEETYEKHFSGKREGRRLTGKGHGIQTFAFSTGPETRMVHLVLFRAGTHDGNSLMFDDIEIR